MADKNKNTGKTWGVNNSGGTPSGNLVIPPPTYSKTKKGNSSNKGGNESSLGNDVTSLPPKTSKTFHKMMIFTCFALFFNK